jgi:hypothetical protein
MHPMNVLPMNALIVTYAPVFSNITQQQVNQVIDEINSKPLTHAVKSQRSPNYLFKRATRRLRIRTTTV